MKKSRNFGVISKPAGESRGNSLEEALEDAVQFASTYRKGKVMSRDMSDLKQVSFGSLTMLH